MSLLIQKNKCSRVNCDNKDPVRDVKVSEVSVMRESQCSHTELGEESVTL